MKNNNNKTQGTIGTFLKKCSQKTYKQNLNNYQKNESEFIKNEFANGSLVTGSAQGTIEYLIILAIIIVLALVVVAFVGSFGSNISGMSETQSQTYWQSAQPISILEGTITSIYSEDNENYQDHGWGIIIQNKSIDPITITSIKMDDSTVLAASPSTNYTGLLKVSNGTYLATSHMRPEDGGDGVVIPLTFQGSEKNGIIMHTGESTPTQCTGLNEIKSIDVEITYTTKHGLTKTQKGTQKLILKCQDTSAANIFTYLS